MGKLHRNQKNYLIIPEITSITINFFNTKLIYVLKSRIL